MKIKVKLVEIYYPTKIINKIEQEFKENSPLFAKIFNLFSNEYKETKLQVFDVHKVWEPIALNQ